MRKLVASVAVLTLLPATSAAATDLQEILERGQEASYTAEQVISCSTPDGSRDAVISLEQTAGELHLSGDVEVSAGYGGWELMKGGSVVTSATVTAAAGTAQATYTVDDGIAHPFLDRKAGLYRLFHGDVLRAELVVDGATGALVSVVTYNEDGSVYCERKFIEFDPNPSQPAATTMASEQALEPGEPSPTLPETLGDFHRLDIYQDDEGFVFAYYSDGFFSFAVFLTPSAVVLNDPNAVTIGESVYARSFAPGQVTYSWETRDGGMALVGDLPPDMHPEVLEDLAAPFSPGLLQRLWRSLFG